MGYDDALGLPVSFPVYGEPLEFARLTNADKGQFESWVRSKRIASAQMAFAPQPGENERAADARKEELREAISSVLCAASSELNILKEMATNDGAIYLIWLSRRHIAPDVTLEAVADMVINGMDQATLDVLGLEIMRVRRAGTKEADDGEGNLTKGSTSERSAPSSEKLPTTKAPQR